ncbi:MAG: nucleoside 2-deoxyribosyltransferase [Myxococcales bacterium]|nr:nucleoside 2-deoxyribosyltransferase [Myxococcales bacterium]
MPTAVVYIAGPLFDRAQRWYNTRLAHVVQEAGFETYLPQADAGEVDLTVVDNRADVFVRNIKALRAAAFVVANLNGPVVDEGTAWECGYAWGLGKKVLGVREAERPAMGTLSVNLMLERSVHLFGGPEALRNFLSEPFAF